MSEPSRPDYSPRTIVNVGDQPWHLSRTYGMYHIPPCPAGARCATVRIEGRVDRADIGDKRFSEFYFCARDIAADLVSDLLDHGVFVAAGEEPTDAEIGAARQRLTEFYQRAVFDADQQWSRTHNFTVLSDIQRRAVKFLGLEREWAFKPETMVECPACGTSVRPGVAVCRACGAVLDSEKAREFGLLPAAEPASADEEAGKRRTVGRR
ncbi:MAG TPA: zinc ribbon domain-containing protein [Candidatus Acidoferrales bacterium]|nr:zinc ribbon domain-containing protein [Candidatus Acidoferrales bacterium]